MCDFNQTYNQIDKMPNQLALEMNMPTHIRERLVQSQKKAHEKFMAKPLEERLKAANENKSVQVVNKIVKAQAHIEKVNANLDQYHQFYEQITKDEVKHFANWAPKQERIAENKLKFQERQAKAALRKDYQIANRIQKTNEFHNRYFIPKEEKHAQKLNNIQQKMQQKMERAEAIRQQQKELKIQKAKEAQEKFMIKDIVEKKRQIRSISQQVQKSFCESETQSQGHISNRSQAQKAVAFYVDLEKSAQRHQTQPLKIDEQYVKGRSEWQPQLLLTQEQKNVKIDEQPVKGRQEWQPQLFLSEDQKKADNDKQVSVPMNMSIQVQKNVQEKQTMSINETKTMVVGGNKLTFNFSINVEVEPIE